MRANWTTAVGRRVTAVGAGLVLVAGLAIATPAASRPADERSGAGATHEEPSVPVSPMSAEEAPSDPTAKVSLRETPEVSWPGADAVEVTATSAAESSDEVELTVDVVDHEDVASANGLVMKVSPADAKAGEVEASLSVDYSAFGRAYGGDWRHRLRVVELPDCAECSPTILPTQHDTKAEQLTADVTVAAQGSSFAVTADAAGPTGDYSATPLSPAGEWEVSAGTGAFTWSYPMTVPDVPGGLTPDVSLSYSSASVDGRIASTNNQPSMVGEGWADVSPGFIERSYRSCAETDGTPETGDLCWFDENATLSFGGRSVELVRVGDSRIWRPKDDDGSRIQQRLNSSGVSNGDVRGENWVLTTTDGVQYHFGSRPAAKSTFTAPVFGDSPGDGCGGSFAASSCDRAWRWNLDYVVDPNENEISYTYAQETNRYDRNMNWKRKTAQYVRGGYLQKIEYGSHADDDVRAQAQVVFGMAERCIEDSSCAQTTANYPDTPLDLKCTSTTDCEGKVSPTFWTTKRLATVTTTVWDGSGYAEVDRWTLGHEFPEPGDDTDEALWLHSITHTGLAGDDVATPAVTFPAVTTLNNRVHPVRDGRPPMAKYRVSRIENGTGGITEITYADADCEDDSRPAPSTNTLRCFPVRWTPEGYADPVNDYFHVYVVGQVTEDDLISDNTTMVTDYVYPESAGAWRYNDKEIIPEERRTWSIWRGYETVKVRRGNGRPEDGPVSETEYKFFRGMHGNRTGSEGTKTRTVTASEGDPVTDHNQYAGFLREEIIRDGVNGEIVSATINDPWHRLAAEGGGRKAYQVEVAAAHTRTALGDGEWQRSHVYTTYNDEGLVTQVHDQADGTEDHCTRIAYARNDDTWLLDRPSSETTAINCSETPRSSELISRVRTYYDEQALGAAPTRGNPTKVQEYQYVPGTPVTIGWDTVSETTYDDYGRPVEAKDPLGHATSTSYDPELGLPTRTTVTNPLGHETTTTLDVRSQPTATEDPNGRQTRLTYDGLGRLTEVTLPGSSNPQQKFDYGLRADGASWVKTERLLPSGAYAANYTLFDGYLRERQTQTPSAGGSGGRVLTDTVYDSRGLAWKVNHPYFNSAAPAGTTLLRDDNDDVDVYRQTVTRYDGAEREVSVAQRGLGRDPWATTTTTYGGDRVAVTPPEGETATTTVTDARGRTVELLQHHGPDAEGPADVTRYTHTPAGKIETITGPDESRWEFAYDLRGRLLESVDPDSGTSTMTYDDAGRLLTRTDGREETVAHSYDELGRKTATHAGSADGPLLASWTYDALPDGRTGGIGMRTSATRHHDGAAYTSAVTSVDPAGRPLGTQVNVPSAAGEELAGDYTTGFTYFADGSLSGIRPPAAGGLPRGERIAITYNSAGLPRTAIGYDDYVANTVYTPTGEVQQLDLDALSGKIEVTRTRDLTTGRLTRSEVTQQSSTTLRTIEDYNYEFDPAGNVTSIADLPHGDRADRQCFDYDHQRRLTAAWTPAAAGCSTPDAGTLGGQAPYWTSYDYGPGGNRASETQHATSTGGDDTVRSYAYADVQPHTLESVTSAGPAARTQADTYEFDRAGNTIARTVDGSEQTVEWDVEGRVESVTTDQGTTSFVYDADGNRLLRRDPTSTTLYLGEQELRLDHATNDVTGTRYYEHAGETIAARTGYTVAFLTGDHHKTATTAVDSESGEVTRRRFDPFGNPRGTVPDGWLGERGFVGGTVDPSLGLTHLGAREYDATTGRFISIDPILDPGDPQQMQGYAYASNNPTTLTDPSGLRACGGGAMIDGTTCAPTKPKPKGPKNKGPKRPASAPDWNRGRTGAPQGHPCEYDCRPPILLIRELMYDRPDAAQQELCDSHGVSSMECIFGTEKPPPIPVKVRGEEEYKPPGSNELSDMFAKKHEFKLPKIPSSLNVISTFQKHRRNGDNAVPAALKTGYQFSVTASWTSYAASACSRGGAGASTVCSTAAAAAANEFGKWAVSDDGAGKYIDRVGNAIQDGIKDRFSFGW